MLHGDIRINGQIIAAWTARRLDELTNQSQVSDYECTYQSINGLMRMTHNTFKVRHRYDAGAAALASEVLMRATRYTAEPATSPTNDSLRERAAQTTQEGLA